MPFVCGNYENRPQSCKDYPKADSYQPSCCGYFFPGDGSRRGRCEEDCDSTCCKLTRAGGEPEGAATKEDDGGEPCKFLVYVEEHVEHAPEEIVKTAGDVRMSPDKYGDW
jgi:hypothetical protein